jgi:signal transduction histidine kinase/ActR/RegA family two-component response regulator
MVIPAGRSPRRFLRIAESLRAFTAYFPRPFGASSEPAGGDVRKLQICAAQTRLLYSNGPTGVVVTVVVASLLAYGQWKVVPHFTVVAWLAVMLLVSAARILLVRRYWRASPSDAEYGPWRAAFAIGAAMSAIGWGGAGIVLYPAARSMNEVFLVFVLGGMMLGAASQLAARPEAFLSFLIPTGALPALRLASEGDQEHLMMALLAGLFTVATVTTTWRFHRTIESSLQLGFENQHLVESLQTAKNQADALNRDLELRVRERTTRLLEADQRKDEFLATLAHELRNPLAPIRFALEGLKPDAPEPIAARAHEVIERQVGQLVRLVDDLLDVSRITANKVHLRREPHALARLMTIAAESVMPLARTADQTLDVVLPSPSMWVNGDATRLVQVFANILNNAVKFTPHGGHIWFTADQDADEAVVRIRDNGIGIAADVLPRVFDMFKQAEPILERSSGGLGVGLTLARRLVEMHEGRIDIRSPGQGQGTEIEIRLPVTTAMVANVIEPERPGVPPPRSFRVLIVDDNVDAAEMLDLLVSALGHTTKVAHDGAAALSAAAEFAPDVIFLDVGLPVINGYAVARKLRELPDFNHVHIAAVTGWGQDEDRRRAREAGFDSHYTKPLSPAVLEDVLARIALGMPPSADPFETPRTRLADSGRAS